MNVLDARGRERHWESHASGRRVRTDDHAANKPVLECQIHKDPRAFRNRYPRLRNESEFRMVAPRRRLPRIAARSRPGDVHRRAKTHLKEALARGKHRCDAADGVIDEYELKGVVVAQGRSDR